MPCGGRSVRAIGSGAGSFLLYDEEFGASLPPRFEAREDGRIWNWHGELTSWTTEDLTDTGETRDA